MYMQRPCGNEKQDIPWDLHREQREECSMQGETEKELGEGVQFSQAP